LGAFLAPIFCSRIARWMSDKGVDPLTHETIPDYRYGFMLAGIGMLLGILVFGIGTPLLRGKGDAPPERKGFGTLGAIAAGCAVAVLPVYFLLSREKIAGIALGVLGVIIVGYFVYFAAGSERVTRDRIFALLILLCANMVFWASFEQAGNSLNFFARQHIEHLSIPAIHWTMVAEDFQSVNAIGIVLLGPLFAGLWIWLARRNANPSIPAKFGLGLVQVGLGFALLLYGMRFVNSAGLIPWFWLVGLYAIHTTGELCLSPVGLSAMTKLAPE
jgi:POT family proton-dependent oligopeptide transporter